MQQMVIALILYLSSSFSENCIIYTNTENEVLVIGKEMCSYRLRNNGGISLYSYFSGAFKKRKDIYKLFDDQFLYAKIERNIITNNSHSKISICFYDDNNNPVQYAPIVLDKNSNLLSNTYYTDESGCITVIPISLFDSTQIVLHMFQLGNTFSQVMNIKIGENYAINLLVPAKYGIQNDKGYRRKFLKIIHIDERKIKLYDTILNTWKIFERIDREGLCHDAILQD